MCSSNNDSFLFDKQFLAGCCENVLATRSVNSLSDYLQTGATEQFEKVVFGVRPLRVALSVYCVASWLKTHPITTVAAVALVTIPVMMYFHVKAQ